MGSLNLRYLGFLFAFVFSFISSSVLAQVEDVKFSIILPYNKSQEILLSRNNSNDVKLKQILDLTNALNCNEANILLQNLAKNKYEKPKIYYAFDFVTNCYRYSGDYVDGFNIAKQWQDTTIFDFKAASQANSLKNMLSELKDAPKLEAITKEFSNIVIEKKRFFGLLNSSATINGKTLPIVFDTGADFNVISQSFAKELKLKIINSSNKVHGNNKIAQYDYGIAENLEIGKNEFKDALFIIVDDKDLNFNCKKNDTIVNVNIPTIIGMPILQAFGTIKITETELIPIQSKQVLDNNWLKLDMNYGLFIDTKINDIKAKMQIDTGAASTIVNTNFVNLNPSIIKNAQLKQSYSAGLAGCYQTESYMIRQPIIGFGDQNIIIQQLEARKSQKNATRNDGFIGQDILSKFEDYTLDFKNSRFRFGKPISESVK